MNRDCPVSTLIKTLFTGAAIYTLAKRTILPPALKSFPRFLFLASCFCALLSLLVYATARDAVSPRFFALFSVLLALGLGVGTVYATKGGQDSNPSLAADSVRVNLSKRKLRIYIIVMLMLLLYGMWATRGAPLLPRMIGAAINAFLTACFVFLLRRTKNTDSA